MNSKMVKAARAGMIHVLDLCPDDRVLVVTDNETRDCGEAFAQAAEDFGCNTRLYSLPADQRPLKKMPTEMNNLLDGVSVVINAIVGDAREIPFRLEWLYLVEAAPGVRLGHSPGINADMMTSGPLNVDYEKMKKRADELQAVFEGATSVHISTSLGTDLDLDLTGRPLVSDLKSVPGTGANLPCGEVYCCPVETGANGTLVIDACFGSYGNVKSPVTMTLENGRVTTIEGEDLKAIEQITQLMDTDDGSRVIAELGIGLNSGARLSDRMLEAEKALRTAHIAFGTNQGMPGGLNESQIHIDYLFKEPTMVVLQADGQKKEVLI